MPGSCARLCNDFLIRHCQLHYGWTWGLALAYGYFNTCTHTAAHRTEGAISISDHPSSMRATACLHFLTAVQ